LLFLDTETCGLIGPIVIIQWAHEDKDYSTDVHIWDVWKESVGKTLEFLELICNNDICAFNLSFDWFHINKLYNLLQLTEDKSRAPIIREIAKLHSHSDRSKSCLKPKTSLDLFLYARKNKWQVLMDRRNIRIKRVPKDLAHDLQSLLQAKIKFSDILFASILYHSFISG